MRKAIGVLFLILLCICLAQAQNTWKLSKDVLATSNQISFDQESNGVWYFPASSSFAHDPKTYQFLPLYSLPCKFKTSYPLVINAPCWEVAIPDANDNLVPIIGANVSYTTQFGSTFAVPARSIWTHPSKFGDAIVAWKSPLSGVVDVSGFFSDLDPTCGNGVRWYVDKGAQQLTSGTIPNGGPVQTFSLTGISVTAGQVLYFLVDPNGDYSCDSTGIDVTITKTK